MTPPHPAPATNAARAGAVATHGVGEELQRRTGCRTEGIGCIRTPDTPHRHRSPPGGTARLRGATAHRAYPGGDVTVAGDRSGLQRRVDPGGGTICRRGFRTTHAVPVRRSAQSSTPAASGNAGWRVGAGVRIGEVADPAAASFRCRRPGGRRKPRSAAPDGRPPSAPITAFAGGAGTTHRRVRPAAADPPAVRRRRLGAGRRRSPGSPAARSASGQACPTG